MQSLNFYFGFALLLLAGTGNGYDEWPLNSYFTIVVLGVGVLWHNFEFLGQLMRPGRRQKRDTVPKEKVEEKSLAKLPYKPVV